MRILMSFQNFNDCQKEIEEKQLQMLEQELSIQPEVSRSSWSRKNE